MSRREIKPIATDVPGRVCECCHKLKTCSMYVLQNGEAAWVCKECREGRK